MSAIGGYFGLELNEGKEYHSNAIRLNTGRNALQYILETNNYNKIYLPFYTCDVLLQPIKLLGIAFEYYSINENFEPQFNFGKIGGKETFLYTNYFGLKDNYILSLKGQCENLILDNAQAFFSRPMEGIDTFYSPRKFFGIPDGAYLYTNKSAVTEFETATSHQRFEHLLRRIDESAESGYRYFVENDKALDNLPILQMSHLTSNILKSIDYDSVAKRRKENFNYVHDSLKTTNLIQFELNGDQVPMVYPYYTSDLNLRKRLLHDKIFTAQYWLSVLDLVDKNSVEFKYANNLIHIPIDQRYNTNDISKILNIVSHEY